MLGFHTENALQGFPGMLLISSSELRLPGCIYFNLGTEIGLGLVPASLVYGFLIHLISYDLIT
jgi:hypothetical protein